MTVEGWLLVAALLVGLVLGRIGSRAWARWKLRRTLMLAAAFGNRAIPVRRCVRSCGRVALDGHYTCGELACDERGARAAADARWRVGVRQ